MNATELSAFITMFLCGDPHPGLKPRQVKAVRDFLNSEAVALGLRDWSHALTELRPAAGPRGSGPRKTTATRASAPGWTAGLKRWQPNKLRNSESGFFSPRNSQVLARNDTRTQKPALASRQNK